MSEKSGNGPISIPECWEFLECPEDVRKVCTAYPHLGRECWKITGTRCAQGTLVKAEFSEKITYCREHCEYFRKYFSGRL